jgi:DNA-binding CsgD family transcriptional regulator
MPPDPDQNLQPPANRWQERLIELGINWRVVPDNPDNQQEISRALKERVKELNCLYSVSQLVDKDNTSTEDFLAMVVDILPPSWQFPEIACSRITMGPQTFESLFFQESRWRLTSTIQFPEGLTGEVSIFYIQSCPPADEGPFLKEERQLLDAVAERIGRVAVRNRIETKLEEFNHQLAVERTALKEANAALRLVLGRIEEQKTETQLNIIENVEKILLPIVRELRISVAPHQKDYVAMLEENLGHITSPFVRKLTRQYQALSPTEIQICGLVRSGLASKDIARLRGVSLATVNRHREHIRHKLGIANRKVNLTAYLQSTM